MVKAPADDARWKSVEITANLMTLEAKKTAAGAGTTIQGPWAGPVAAIIITSATSHTHRDIGSGALEVRTVVYLDFMYISSFRQ